MKEWFKSLLSDERGSVSSKRVVGIMCAIILCIVLYKNSMGSTHTEPSSALVESVAALAAACLGLSSLDKFTFKGTPKTEEPVKEEPAKEEPKVEEAK